MPVSFEAIGYSSICSDQEYTGYTATENLVELFKSLVKKEYTEYTATENLVQLFKSLVIKEYTEYTASSNCHFSPFFASYMFVNCLITMPAVC